MSCACMCMCSACVGTGIQLETRGEPYSTLPVYARAKPHNGSSLCCFPPPPATAVNSTASTAHCPHRSRPFLQHSKQSSQPRSDNPHARHASHPHSACLATNPHRGNSHRSHSHAHTARSHAHTRAALRGSRSPPASHTQHRHKHSSHRVRPRASCNCAPAFAWQTFLSANPSAST